MGENAAIGEHLAVLLAGFAPGNREARQQGLPSLAASHGTVFGSLSEHGVPMAGFDHGFTTGALFGCEAQAVMLGHIHRHQAWAQEGRGQRIAYAGSIGRFHHGEQGDKGFLLWRVAAQDAEFSLVPTPACRMVDIVFDGQPDLEEVRRVIQAQDIQGARVRVRWTSFEEDRHAVDRVAITRLLEGAADIRLEGRIAPVVRARAPGIAQRGSMVDKVKTWATLTGVEPGCVLECLEALQQAAPAEIAGKVLGTQ